MAVKRAVDGIRDLIERTAGPKVVSRVVVDQAYAQEQHEDLSLRHPRGGQAKYLELPMKEKSEGMMERIATRLLKAPSTPELWDTEAGQRTQALVREFAPIEFGNLRESAAVTTYVGGAVAYKHEAPIHRLSPAQLKALDSLRGEHGWRRE